MITRNPTEYMRRRGIQHETAQPRPRLDVQALLVNTYPLSSPPKPPTEVLLQFEGDPPPDRNVTRPWPSQHEET